MLSLPLAVSAITVLITFILAAWQDWRSRTVYRVTWYPAAVICLVSTSMFWIYTPHTSLSLFTLVLSIILALCFALFAYLKLFGWADAYALILLSLAVPITPFAESISPSLTVSTIINAGVLSLTIPVGCLIYNLAKKNRAPLWLMFSGRPVRGEGAADSFGFLAEEIQEIDGVLVRRFLKARETIFSLRRKNDAENLCKKCDAVWITIGIPLIVPLTGGLILAMFGISALDLALSILY